MGMGNALPMPMPILHALPALGLPCLPAWLPGRLGRLGRLGNLGRRPPGPPSRTPFETLPSVPLARKKRPPAPFLVRLAGHIVDRTPAAFPPCFRPLVLPPRFDPDTLCGMNCIYSSRGVFTPGAGERKTQGEKEKGKTVEIYKKISLYICISATCACRITSKLPLMQLCGK